MELRGSELRSGGFGDAYGAAVLRESETTPMHASRRRALTLRYAHAAGRRLMRHVDPTFGL